MNKTAASRYPFFNWLKKLDILPVLIFLYLICFGLDLISSATTFRLLPGLLLIAVTPGFYVATLTNLPLNRWHLSGRVGFYILFSATIVCLAQFITKSAVALTPLSQSALILLINGLLYIGCRRQRVDRPTIGNIIDKTKSYGRPSLDLLVLLFPILIYLVMYAINPTVDNVDNHLDHLYEVIKLHVNQYGTSRVFFLPYLAAYHYITGLSPVTLYKHLLSLSFFISLSMLFSYLWETIKSKRLLSLTYFLLAAAPVIFVEATIVRPQVMVMVFTLPVFVLLAQALKTADYRFSALAILFSLTATGFHELGIVLLLMSLGLTAIQALIDLVVKKRWTITLRHIILAVIIILPYLRLVSVSSLTEPAIHIARYAASFFKEVKWDWWFIDHYTTIDGYQLGWPGIQAIYYYLYNGLLFALAAVGLWLTVLISRQRIAGTNSWWLYLPAGLYILIYLAAAEVLPRLGLFFLPNRAWPHLMLGLVFLLALFIGRYQKIIEERFRVLVVIFVPVIVLGLVGTLYITYNRVGTVFPDEIAAAHFIDEQLPSRSVFMSTQPNYDLVAFYGKRHFISLTGDYKISNFQTEDQFITDTTNLIDRLDQPTRAYTVPEQSVITTYYSGDTVTATDKVVLAPAKRVVSVPEITRDSPVYFIYSFKKLTGLNGQREYNQQLIDKAHEQFFRQLANRKDLIVYQDPAIIIIKLRQADH